jgi:hypothetical protein
MLAYVTNNNAISKEGKKRRRKKHMLVDTQIMQELSTNDAEKKPKLVNVVLFFTF